MHNLADEPVLIALVEPGSVDLESLVMDESGGIFSGYIARLGDESGDGIAVSLKPGERMVLHFTGATSAEVGVRLALFGVESGSNEWHFVGSTDILMFLPETIQGMRVEYVRSASLPSD